MLLEGDEVNCEDYWNLVQKDRNDNYDIEFLDTVGDDADEWFNIQFTFGYMPSD
jgi:hypothetical protein